MTFTPETIITAELLAGLTACPFCGAGVEKSVVCGNSPIRTEFKCGTWLWVGKVPQLTRDSDLWSLRARVLSLESKVERLTEAGDALAPWCYSESVFNSWTRAKEST